MHPDRVGMSSADWNSLPQVIYPHQQASSDDQAVQQEKRPVEQIQKWSQQTRNLVGILLAVMLLVIVPLLWRSPFH